MSDNCLYERAREEILRHLEDSEISKLSHWEAAAVIGKKHRNRIAIPAIILSALLTWLLQYPFEHIFEAGTARFFSTDIPRFIALLVTLLTALDLKLGMQSLESAHRNAALSYQEVWRHCKNWATDFPDASLAQKAAQAAHEYRDRLNSINRNSPQIPKWAWKSVDAQRKAGSVSYEVDSKDRLNAGFYDQASSASK